VNQNIPRFQDVKHTHICAENPHAFLVTRSGSGIMRFGQAGLRACDLLGMDLRSMPVRSLIAPPDRENFSNILMNVVTTPQMAELGLSTVSPGRACIRFRRDLASTAPRPHVFWRELAKPKRAFRFNTVWPNRPPHSGAPDRAAPNAVLI